MMKQLSNDIFLSNIDTPLKYSFEVVERKGLGHPDTLSDALAEELSRVYSKYTLSNFKAILHHNFDKVGLLGGSSHVEFGKGYMKSPIRVLLNGRASSKFGSIKIPVKEILESTALNFLLKRFPMLNPKTDIKVCYNLSTTSSPGNVEEKSKKNFARRYWFKPRGLHDLQELKNLCSNDTSSGCAFAPLSNTEKTVLDIERRLNSDKYRKNNPWIGSDIKVMATSINGELGITICVPQIADHVPDMNSYIRNIQQVRLDIINIAKKRFNEDKVSISINTRDKINSCELYLTATGSSIESGDEGLVGRGNRINGLITPCRPMSIEGVCGKNPVYHVGKIYNIAARSIAERINKEYEKYVEVYIISQSGRFLTKPWKTIILIENGKTDEENILSIVRSEIERMPEIKNSLLDGKIELF
jgi:S-adenosylmethionine synthetase